MLLLGVATALWCVGLALTLVRSQLGTNYDWIASALVGFAVLLFLVGERRDQLEAPPTA
jgi:threonine/homoserine efflux transporter RhtA